MQSPLITHLASTLLALGLSVVTASPTFAGIALNTIDPVARLIESGREVIVTGPVVCTVGERIKLHVTVTQRGTGAVGQGDTRLTCTGALQQWEVRVSHHKRAAFAYGAATAVALARTRAQGAPTDAHQWLVELTVVE